MPSWRSCSRSCTSTGPPGTRARYCGPRRVRSGLISINQAATLEYQPLGVVGVIGPWNYPVFTPMGSIAYALAAGNAVVFKPSELDARRRRMAGQLVCRGSARAAGAAADHGRGPDGRGLARSGVSKIAFTGSAATARKVMAACAENLTPMVAECGGKDAFLVAGDADLDAAADACAWGALSNAGQTCIGVERVYVVEDVYHTFLEKLTERVAADPARRGPGGGLRADDDARPDRGRSSGTSPTRWPGAAGRSSAGSASIRGPMSARSSWPTCRRRAAAVTEETFGPTMTVDQGGVIWPRASSGRTPAGTGSAPRCSPAARSRP